MKYILSLIISGALVVSGFGQTRNVLVNTNNVVVQPTNFWSTDASNARTGLGLGTAATNDASAFQPSSLALSNLASSNGVNLTNISVSGIVGALATNGNAANLTNFPSNLLRTNGSAAGLTNFPANLLTTNGNGSGLTSLAAANINGTVALASNLSSPLALTNGGTGATNAATARTNLGFGFIDPAITSFTLEENSATDVSYSEASGFKWSFSAFGPATNYFAFYPVYNPFGSNSYGWRFGYSTNSSNLETKFYIAYDGHIEASGTSIFDQLEGGINIPTNKSITFTNELAAATTRTNLGLGWQALTNSNSGTSLVSVNTNGDVVSPTNFWQQAPIASTYQESIPVTNSTNLANGSRSLHLHSLSPSINNVTNVILLRTNGTAFAGDNATIVHKGPTNSMTIVRSDGSTNNLITMTRFNEAVKFVYYGSVWNLDHNLSFVEPIYFAGTNTVAHIAETRTNLGLPLTALTNTNNANFQAAVFATNSAPTNSANVNTVNFNTAVAWIQITVSTNGTNHNFRIPLFQ